MIKEANREIGVPGGERDWPLPYRRWPMIPWVETHGYHQASLRDAARSGGHHPDRGISKVEGSPSRFEHTAVRVGEGNSVQQRIITEVMTASMIAAITAGWAHEFAAQCF